jgi:hypothetical protein
VRLPSTLEIIVVGLTNIQNLQDLQNGKVSRMPDSAPPRWNVEAPSANAICTINYSLTQLYSIYVIPIDVLSRNATSNKSTHVKSRKLRHKSIPELIEGKLPNSSCDFTHAIQFWAESRSIEHPIDHLIIQFRTTTKLLEHTSAITSIGNDFPADFQAKRTVMSVRDVEGALVEELVMCKVHKGMTFQPGKHLSPSQNSEVYWKKFGAILRMRLHQISCYGMTNTSESSKSLREIPSKVIRTLFPPNVAAYTQTKLKLNPFQKKVHLEFDLLPGVKEFTLLHDLVLGIYGLSILRPDLQHGLLKDIRGLLTGLAVSRNYIIPQFSSAGANGNRETKAGHLNHRGFPSQSSPPKTDKVPLLGQVDLATLAEQDKSCDSIIEDVEPISSVASFLYKGQHYSVAKYFDKGECLISAF